MVRNYLIVYRTVSKTTESLYWTIDQSNFHRLKVRRHNILMAAWRDVQTVLLNQLPRIFVYSWGIHNMLFDLFSCHCEMGNFKIHQRLNSVARQQCIRVSDIEIQEYIMISGFKGPTKTTRYLRVWDLCMTLLHQMSFYFIPSCFCQGPSRDMHNLNNIIIFKNTEWDMSIIFTMVLNCLMSLKYVCVAHWYVCSTCIYV